VVRAAPFDPGGVEGVVPLSGAPVVERQVAALRRREHQGGVEPRREPPVGVERPRGEWHPAPRPFRFRVRGHDPVADATLYRDCSSCLVDVAAFERRPLVRAEPCLGGEDDEGAVGWAELGVERVDLGQGERLKLLGTGLRVRPGLRDRVDGEVAPANSSIERLPKRQRQAVARRVRQSDPPGGNVGGSALQFGQRPGAEPFAGWHQSLSQRGLRARRHGATMAL
jgi:hypothetical protein